MSKYRKLLIAGTILAASVTTPVLAEKLGLGRAALPDEIAAWNLDVSPGGAGLPDGSGSVTDGEEIFSERCAACHGEFAEGVGNWPKLAGGEGTLANKDPLKTVGSYWPYLSTVWDYVHRSMPFGEAQSLEPDQVYAITAYILYSNYLVDEDFVLSKDNFLDVGMLNADGFIVDHRETAEAHFWDAPCMEDCKNDVKITMHASVLDVTPDTVDDAIPAAAEAVPAAAPAEATDASQMAAADVIVTEVDPEVVAAGEKVFKKCKACHQIGDGAENKVGPELNGVVGRAAASIEGFKYSKPMIAAGEEGLVWTDETLTEYLADPRKFIKGTKMTFGGLKKAEDLHAIIAYLASVGS